MVVRLAGLHIGADNVEFGGVGFEGIEIKRIMHERHLSVAEILAVQVAIAEEIADAAIALVIAEAFIVAYGTANLVGFVVHAEGCPGRNTHNAIEGNAVLHHHIHDTGGEHATHGTAFQYKSPLHLE